MIERKDQITAMETMFMGVTVTRDQVLSALRDFDAMYPDNNDYDNWREKKIYKYAIEYGDCLYPPKHILSVMTGISTQELSGGEQTNRVFRQLGLKVIDKP
jgi:hypothetical protein